MRAIKTTSDVKNPSPDRRMKDDWRRFPIIRAGAVFVVHTNYFDRDDEGDPIPFDVLRPVRVNGDLDRFAILHEVIGDDDLAKLVLDASEPYELSHREWLHEHYRDACTYLVVRMLEMGKITRADIDAAEAAAKENDDA